jgi:2-hydroxychromene-2-carboxylate isomerase
MKKSVDFYFDFSSTNSYFAAFLLPAICERNGASINWLPLHLASIFRGTGFSVTATSAVKSRYLWRDHQRYAEITGLPFRRPSRFPIKTSIALRGVLAARRIAEGAAAEFSQAVFRAYWERDEDISESRVIAAIAESAQLDSRAFLNALDSDGVRNELAAVTARAIERGVFGAPTFFVGEEMFWGKDRLDLVERELRKV